MGVSSDGVLYFGFPVGEDECAPEWMSDYSARCVGRLMEDR